MHATTLVVPGLHGSGPEHWQTWMERRIPGARRVEQADWDSPVLARWAGSVRRQIDRAEGAVWIVAHSFGCLAAVVAAADRRDRVAGALLVAPADPDRFSPQGVRNPGAERFPDSIGPLLPPAALGFPSAVVASANDPWLPLAKAAYWADRWGSRILFIGDAGHVNTESGFGPWPRGLELLYALRSAQAGVPLGSLNEPDSRVRRPCGALARLQRDTRAAVGLARWRPGRAQVRGR